MSNPFGSLFGGAATAYSLNELLGDLETQRANVDERLRGADGTGGIVGDVTTRGEFTPWGVTSRNVGSTTFDANNQLTTELSEPMQGFADAMRTAATGAVTGGETMDPAMALRAGQYYDGSIGAMTNARGNVANRESDIYGRIRAMQRPEEQRQLERMQAGLFSTGRGGMVTDAYGGSPEEFAFGKAQAEARNQASLSAMGQAQQELMNQGQLSSIFGNLGASTYGTGLREQQTMGQLSGMFSDNMLKPYAQNLAQSQLGLQGASAMNQQNQQLAGLLAQLGIGGLTTDVNYANVIGGVYGKMAEAVGSAAAGGGGLFGQILDAINTPTTTDRNLSTGGT